MKEIRNIIRTQNNAQTASKANTHDELRIVKLVDKAASGDNKLRPLPSLPQDSW